MGWLHRLRPARALVPVTQMPAAPPGWTLPGLAVANALWGQGFIAPLLMGELPHLCAQDRVLLVGAGPGGAARLLSGQTGAEIVAFESDPLLATLGGARRYSPRAPDFGRQDFDHAVLLEGWEGGRMEDVLAATAFALRPGGRVAVVACVEDPVALARVLGHLRCMLEGAEERSADLATQATAAWARLARSLERAGGEAALPLEGRVAVQSAAQGWMKRLHRLRAGTLHHVHLTARGRGIGVARVTGFSHAA